MSHKRPAVAAQRDDSLDEPAVYLSDSGEHGEEAQHGHENEGQRDLGGQPDAEPDHEERGEDHARDGVEQSHHRLEQFRDEANEGRDDAQQNANGNAERKTAERGTEGCVEMRPSKNSSTSAAPTLLGLGAYMGLSKSARPAASQTASRIANAASCRIQALRGSRSIMPPLPGSPPRGTDPPTASRKAAQRRDACAN